MTEPLNLLHIQNEICQLNLKVTKIYFDFKKKVSSLERKSDLDLKTLISTNLDELEYAAFLKTINVNYQNLNSNSFGGNVLQSIRYFKRAQQTSVLKRALLDHHPHINWIDSFPFDIDDSLIPSELKKLTTLESCLFLLLVFFSVDETLNFVLAQNQEFEQVKNYELLKQDLFSVIVIYFAYKGQSHSLIEFMRKERPEIGSIQKISSRFEQKSKITFQVDDLLQAYSEKKRKSLKFVGIKSNLFQQTLHKNFLLVEIKELYFDLGMDFEQVEDSKESFVFSFIQIFTKAPPKHREKIKSQLKLAKPTINWDKIILKVNIEPAEKVEIPSFLSGKSSDSVDTFAVRQLALEVWEDNEDLFVFCKQNLPFMRLGMSAFNDKRENILNLMNMLKRRNRLGELITKLEIVYPHQFQNFAPYS